MKVLLICGGDHKYGSPRSAISFIRSITTLDPTVEYVVLTQNYGKINEFCNERGIENYITGHSYAVYKAEHGIIDFVKHHIRRYQVQKKCKHALKYIEKKIDMSSIDLIHTNINRDILGQLIAMKYKVPHIMHLREFSKRHFDLDFIFKDQIELMNQYTDRFIAISDAVKEDWIQTGLNEKKVTRVYNGVEPRSQVRSETRQGIVKIVMVGGLYPEKGQMQLVKAIGLLDETKREMIHVDFYGDGKPWYERELKDYVSAHNLEKHITFKGYDACISEKLADYDIGLLCSKAEGFGLTTVEYMISSLCPIVSDTGANSELVIDGECGLLYKYDDTKDLAAKILTCINNPSLRREYGIKARKRAENMFTIDKCANNILKIYREVSN